LIITKTTLLSRIYNTPKVGETDNHNCTGYFKNGKQSYNGTNPESEEKFREESTCEWSEQKILNSAFLISHLPSKIIPPQKVPFFSFFPSSKIFLGLGCNISLARVVDVIHAYLKGQKF
jgi:hypothetical protein